MGMEREARELLIKVSKSMAVALLWLMINMTFGIYLGWLFFGERMTAGNYVFYAFMITSLIGMIWYLVRLWR